MATALAVLAGSVALAAGTAAGVAAMPTVTLVGIGGAPCAYATIGDAIAAASSGATIYISPGTYNEALGVVDLDLHFTAATADCTQADPAANPSSYIIDAGGAAAVQGGLVNIAANRTVTFTRLTLQDAQATLGGLIYVAGGAVATFDTVRLREGDAANLGGILYVAPAASVQVLNLSVIEVGSAGIAGGGLYLEGAAKLTAGSVIRESQSPLGGGAALAGTGHLTLTQAHIGSPAYGNQAGAGGGVYLGGQSRLELRQGSSVRWNQATATDGGGVYATGAVFVELYGTSRIFGNTALNNGGGLYAGNGATVVMNDNSQLGGVDPTHGNEAVRGGGLYASDALTVTLQGAAAVLNNSAGDGGGGIFLTGGTALSMTGGLISDNTTTGWGGGLAIAEGDAVARGTEFSGNSAMDGGGVALDGDVDNSLSAINTHFISNTAGVDGGGIHVRQGSAAVIAVDGQASLSGNHADQNGGGAFAAEGASLVLGSLNVDDQVWVGANTANGSGGGFYADGADDVILFGNTWITGNIAIGSGGGWYQTGGNVLVFGLTTDFAAHLEGNTAANGHGGGAYFTNVSTGPGDDGAVFVNLFVTRNQADTDGGGLYVGGGSHVLLANPRVHDNQTGQDGAGVMVSAARLEVFQHADECHNAVLPANNYCSEFRNNTTSGNGGAIALELAAELVMTHTAIISNGASLGSGVMSFSNGDELDITNSLFTDNTGKALYLAADADLELVQNTFAGNNWAIDINDNGAVAAMWNNIIWGNGFGVESAIAPVVGCSISQNGVGGAANDPLFQATGRGSYRLAAGSPAIDACLVGVVSDLDGLPRPQGGNFDMGAFESGLPLVLFAPALNLTEGHAGVTPGAFTVSLSETSAQTVTLDVKSTDREAVSGLDYTAVNTTLVFAPGVISQSVPLQVLGDITYEATETFTLTLSSPSGAALTAAAAVMSIANDDGWPAPALDNVAVVEGDTGTVPVTITVSLSNPSAFTYTVGYSTSDDTAVAGEDYVEASASLNFAPGATTAQFIIRIQGDVLAEPDEQFAVWLNVPAAPALLGGGPGDMYAWVTILDNDGQTQIYLPLISR